jgi:hypothetical protein
MMISREKLMTPEEELVQVPLRQPQISRKVRQDWTWGQRITAEIMAPFGVHCQ